MPRRCTVCDHPARAEIDRASAGGTESNRSVAARLGLTPAAVHRHARAHVATELRRARDAADVARADSLLDEVRGLQARTLRILASAEAAGDAATALRAVREARGGLELLAKLLGELDEAPTVNVSVNAGWPALRTALLSALEPFPEARRAVVQAIADDHAI
jgi:hypothetical protein